MSRKIEISDELEKEICTRYKNGESSIKLHNSLGIPKKRLLALLNSHGIVRKGKDAVKAMRALADEDEVELCGRYQAGELSTQLSNRYSINVATVMRILKRNGIPLNKDPRKGLYKYRLSHDQEKDVCLRYLNGENTPSIAKFYSTSKVMIRNSLKRGNVPMRTSGASLVQYKVNESAFDIVTDESAYWIGMLMADGCILDDMNGVSASIRLSLKKSDIKHIEKFKAFLEAENPISIFANQACITIRSRYLVNTLGKFGIIPRKTFKETVPNQFKTNRHFWRGMIDGDGGVWMGIEKRPSVCFCGSLSCVEDFVTYTKIKAPLYRGTALKHSSIFQMQVRGEYAIHLLRELYQDGDQHMSLNRKFNTAQKFIHDFDIKYPDGVMRTRLDEHKVRSIRKLFGEISIRDIAKRFGVSIGVIKQIKYNRSWIWVT